MRTEPLSLFRAITVSALVAVAVPQSIAAQAPEHLISPSDLQKAAVGASQQRQQNLDTLKTFLSSGLAKKAIEAARMDPAQVNRAVASLSDDELAQLAQRANKAQANFAGGLISDHDLILIVVAIAVIILIIVAVR